MPAMALTLDLFSGLSCLLILAVILGIVFLTINAVMRIARSTSGDTKSSDILRLKTRQIKAIAGLCIVSLFAFGIWKLVFEPTPASDSFKEVFHQLPPPSVHNLTVPEIDSWGDSTIIGLTFQVNKPDLLKLIGKNGKVVPPDEYVQRDLADLLKNQPGKLACYFTSTKLCDPSLATCRCTIGYDDVSKTAYVYSSAND